MTKNFCWFGTIPYRAFILRVQVLTELNTWKKNRNIMLAGTIFIGTTRNGSKNCWILAFAQKCAKSLEHHAQLLSVARTSKRLAVYRKRERSKNNEHAPATTKAPEHSLDAIESNANEDSLWCDTYWTNCWRLNIQCRCHCQSSQNTF